MQTVEGMFKVKRELDQLIADVINRRLLTFAPHERDQVIAECLVTVMTYERLAEQVREFEGCG